MPFLGTLTWFSRDVYYGKSCSVWTSVFNKIDASQQYSRIDQICGDILDTPYFLLSRDHHTHHHTQIELDRQTGGACYIVPAFAFAAKWVQ